MTKLEYVKMNSILQLYKWISKNEALEQLTSVRDEKVAKNPVINVAFMNNVCQSQHASGTSYRRGF